MYEVQRQYSYINNYQLGYDDVMLQVRPVALERERHQRNYIAYVWIRFSSFGHLKVGFEALSLQLTKDAHEDITAVAIPVLHSFHSKYILPALPPSMTASPCLKMFLSYVAPHDVSLLHIPPNDISFFLRSPNDVSRLVHSPNDVSFLLSPYS
jgi:hypothetical protein